MRRRGSPASSWNFETVAHLPGLPTRLEAFVLVTVLIAWSRTGGIAVSR